MLKPLLRWLSLLPFGVLGVGACGGTVIENGSLGAGGGSVVLAGAAGTTGMVASAGSSVDSGGAPGVAGNAASSAGSGVDGSNDITACVSNTDCEVAPAVCCSCGTSTIGNFTAINAKYDTVFGPKCGAIACGPCATVSPDANPTLYYVATCRAGQCTVIDLQPTTLTTCTDDSQCVLRAGTQCCSGCSGDAPIALNAAAEPQLEKLVCADGPQACDTCARSFPDWSATCDAASGKCRVTPKPCTDLNPCTL